MNTDLKIKNNKEAPKKSITKPLIIVIIGLIVIFGSIFGWGIMRTIFMKRFFAHFAPPPVTISTTKAISETWQPNITAPGSLVAINGVKVNPQVPGQVIKIYFDSGKIVKEGDPLVKLDDADDVQDFKNYQAQWRLAQISYQRQSKLYKTGSAAAAALDQARANMQQTEALMKKTQVTIDRKTIRAPFDGKIGIRQVNLGQYLSAGDPIASLQMLDPLYVQFSLPEQDLKLLYLSQPIILTVESQGDKTFPGKITAINSEVNTSTRNILVQGTVPNPQKLLYPGMYANVQVILPQQQRIITIPQTAINYNLFGDTVFVVKAEGQDKKGKPILHAKLTYVTVGDRRGNRVAIVKGLSAGDEIVTSGQLKLQDGSVVIVNNAVDIEKRQEAINLKS